MKFNRESIEFSLITMVIPAVVYWFIEGTLVVRTSGQELLAVFVAVAGLVVWAIRNS